MALIAPAGADKPHHGVIGVEAACMAVEARHFFVDQFCQYVLMRIESAWGMQGASGYRCHVVVM
jgi:hypothetical protein